MLRRLARIFSGFTLIVLALGIWAVLRGPLSPPPGLPPLDLPPGQSEPLVGPVSRILVEKSARRMTVYVGEETRRVYRIALGFAPEGDKRQEGDGRTPEGTFRIDRRNDASAYHLSLGIDYPQPADRAAARARGVSPGGDIFFHGQPNTLPAPITLRHDWTAGCIALSNAEMTELFEATPIGAEVEIRP